VGAKLLAEKDKRLRTAIEHAIDKNEIINTVLYGKEVKADDVAENISDKQETIVAQETVEPQKTRAVTTGKATKESAERKQQRAVLNVLEKQYEQVRCAADAKNLSGDSFCRQEERRLFLEIQRIKDELRGIKE